MDWITVDLPWSAASYDDLPKAPDLTVEAKKLFGFYDFNNPDFVKKFEDWYNRHPDVIDWQNTCSELTTKMENTTSFTKLGLNQPGTLIEIEEASEIKKYLIGDINTLGGVCDDCVFFSPKTVVKRYKKLDL